MLVYFVRVLGVLIEQLHERPHEEMPHLKDQQNQLDNLELAIKLREADLATEAFKATAQGQGSAAEEPPPPPPPAAAHATMSEAAKAIRSEMEAEKRKTKKDFKRLKQLKSDLQAQVALDAQRAELETAMKTPFPDRIPFNWMSRRRWTTHPTTSYLFKMSPISRLRISQSSHKEV